MTIFKKSMIVTTTGMIALTGMAIQADACGLGDADFKVTADILNVRTGPGTEYPVATKLKKGAIVKPTELKNGWSKIGTNKWVSHNYLSMIDNCTIPENGSSYQKITPTNFVVNASALNLRSEPSTKASKVKVLNKGEMVTAFEQHGNWYHVTAGHFEGWVSKDYVVKQTVNNTTNQNSSAIKEEKVTMRELTVVNTDSLNIRKGPGTSYEITGTLKRGESVMSNIKSGDWYKIDAGWIHKNYVDVTIFSLNSNSTWDDLLDPPAMDEEDDNLVSGSQYVIVNVPEGDKDGGLNVRLSPNLKGSIKTTLKSGTVIEKIYETKFGSTRVGYKINGKTEYGYVSSKYLVPAK